LFLEELVQVGYSFGYRKAHEYHFLHERGWQNRIQKLEPTAGFEPATRYLQIRRQLNSARDFRFPCIPRISIESKEFHSGGYNGGYRRQGL